MIANYLNQTVSYKAVSATDEYGEKTFSTSSIAARYEYKRRLIRTREGEEVLSKATCYTLTAVKSGDVITFDSKDWIILDVENCVDLNGNIKFYTAYLGSGIL